MIRNPILPGFNPDPSICRVGRDYYIATSTVEWYPGVQIHWRTDGEWQPAGPILDASLVSDEAGRGEHGSFTCAFVGMAAFDISGLGRPADFDRFSYAGEG